MEKNTEQNRIEEIAAKWLTGKVSAEEEMEFNAWFRAGNELPFVIAEEYARSEDEHKMKIWNVIQTQLNPAKQQDKKIKTLWPHVRVAAGIAAAVATIVFGVWFFAYRSSNTGDILQPGVYANDIAPGKNGATVTLSTGEVIQLDSTKQGVKIDPTSLTYDDGSKGAGFRLKNGSEVQMTAQTAKGQTYEFTLPDGTHVFLNAGSKIIFPSQFSGKERRILLEGEAYFVVKHNEKQPFRVESKGSDGIIQVVEDIGTEFNINAYRDENNIKTTLVEGLARVSLQTSVLILSPNEQASSNSGKLTVAKIDPRTAIAWKNGKFVFEYETITSVMRKLARWYNVEVVYQGDFQGKTFTGSISRFDNISKILDKISYTQDVHFKIEGRRVTVMP